MKPTRGNSSPLSRNLREIVGGTNAEQDLRLGGGPRRKVSGISGTLGASSGGFAADYLDGFGEPKRFQDSDKQPTWIEFSTADAEFGAAGILVMVIMQAFAGGDEGDPLQIGGGILEILVADHVADAVDDRAQKNVCTGLRKVRHRAPHGSKQKAKNEDGHHRAQ